MSGALERIVRAVNTHNRLVECDAMWQQHQQQKQHVQEAPASISAAPANTPASLDDARREAAARKLAARSAESAPAVVTVESSKASKGRKSERDRDDEGAPKKKKRKSEKDEKKEKKKEKKKKEKRHKRRRHGDDEGQGGAPVVGPMPSSSSDDE